MDKDEDKGQTGKGNLTLFDDSTARELETESNPEQDTARQDAPHDGAHAHAGSTSGQDSKQEPEQNPKSTAVAPEGRGRKENEHNMSEDFASVLETFEAEQSAEAAAAKPADDHDHKVIKGTVINITPTHVVVDIGNKTDGMVPIAQATDRNGNVLLQVSL